MKKNFIVILSLLMVMLSFGAVASENIADSYATQTTYALLDVGSNIEWMTPTYSLYDIDKDGIEELLIKKGSCEADYHYSVYTYQDGENVYIGDIPGGHGLLYSYEVGNGVLFFGGQMGYEWLVVYSYENGGLTETKLFESEMPDGYYIPDGLCPGSVVIETDENMNYREADDTSYIYEFFAQRQTQQEISVYVNGDKISFEQQPVIQNGRTMVPMRAIFESLNTSVTWDDETKSILAENNSDKVELQIGNMQLVKNGATQDMDTAPIILNERTFVPVRAISQALGAQVDWNEDSRSVFITMNEKPIVEITMEDGGVMCLELYPQIAPRTVENFVKLVNAGFYDGLTFHRIIKDFMVQGGDPTGTGMGGSDSTILGEFAANGFKNTIKHERGVISMARASNPDSASSQFFIMLEEAPHLDGQYAAFGRMISGFDVLDSLAQTQVADNNGTVLPENQPAIKSVTMK